jgi:hypothetical protein
MSSSGLSVCIIAGASAVGSPPERIDKSAIKKASSARPAPTLKAAP